MDGCADPLVLYDKNGMAVYLNPAFERVFGWSADELIGKRIDFVPDQCIADTQRAVELVIQGQTVLGMETLRKTKHKGEIHVRLSANAVTNNHHEFDGIIVTLQDISDLVRSRQAAIRANQAKNDFLSNISHEVRTPMNGLMGILNLLENTRLDSEQHEYVTVLKKSAKNLMSVINDILDFSKIEFGKVTCRRIGFDLRTLLDTVVKEFDKKARQKGLALLLSVHQQVPSLLIGDPEKLRQIIVHLLDNAVKFCEKGKIEVVVSARKETETHVDLQLTVADTGIGIEPDQLKTIFRSFSQADSSSTRRFGGIGIGLSLSSRLVHLMGGKLSVDSSPGSGSVFTICLKMEKQPPVFRADRIDRPKSIKGKKILMVDEDDASRLILKEMCEGWGCRFYEAAGIKRAAEKLKPDKAGRHPFDILLIDMAVSGGKGEMFAARVTSQWGTDMILILLFEVGRPGDIERLKKIGVDGYLPKPVNPDILFDCITTAMALTAIGKKRIITRHFLKENEKQQVRILLSDSESANVKRVKNILNKSGFAVVTEQNRIRCIERFESEWFDIVLLAIDPTNNDAVEAISVMREHALHKKNEKFIIIGMIPDANAKDDLFKVDDYIVKPIAAPLLLAAIELWVKRLRKDTRKSDTYAGVVKSNRKTGIFNLKAALERAMDDTSFLQEVLGEFIKALPAKMDKIRHGISDRDSALLSLTANSLRGSSSSVGADRICSSAKEIEKLSDIGDFRTAADVLRQVEGQYHEFKAYIKDIDWSGI